MDYERVKLLKQAIIDGYPPPPAPLDSVLAQRLSMPSVQDYAKDRKRIDPAKVAFMDQYLDPNIASRGMIAPVGKNKQGDPEWVMPQMAISILDSLSLPGRALKGEQISPNQVTRSAMDYSLPGLLSPKASMGTLGMGSYNVAKLRAEANANRFGDVDPNIDGKLTQSAKDYFGVTQDPRETGYMLLDGSRLDLSGRHYAGGYEKKGDRYVAKSGEHDYLGGDRAADHRELYDLPGVKHGEHAWDAVENLMTSTGAVRYMPNQGISIISGQKISDKQISLIVGDFRKNNIPLSIDIDPKGGGSAPINKTFDRPTVGAVREFIDSNSKGNRTKQ